LRAGKTLKKRKESTFPATKKKVNVKRGGEIRGEFKG